jgi:hypothetical protein
LGVFPGEVALKRRQLEHVIRAAGAVTDCRELIVIGSQAILATYPEAPAALLVSQEADVYVPEREELSTLIDGTIGELSPFHQTFGYYGHGVGPSTAILPSGWESRLVKLENDNTNGVRGLCLSALDIFYSKLAAGRPKDLNYCRELLRHKLVDVESLRSLVSETKDPLGQTMSDRLQAITESN